MESLCRNVQGAPLTTSQQTSHSSRLGRIRPFCHFLCVEARLHETPRVACMADTGDGIAGQVLTMVAKRCRDRESRQTHETVPTKLPAGGWLYKIFGRQVDAFEAADRHNAKQLDVDPEERAWARVVSIETNASGKAGSVQTRNKMSKHACSGTLARKQAPLNTMSTGRSQNMSLAVWLSPLVPPCRPTPIHRLHCLPAVEEIARAASAGKALVRDHPGSAPKPFIL